jgi:N-acetylglucosaminyldiphosphoundecaprenol N-acetyl-beta-D-mannosaminyltransferase
MSLDAGKILEISITKNSKSEILEFIQKSLANGAKLSEFDEKTSQKTKKIITIVTPNPEQIVYAQKDSHFRELLNQADVALPDGIGVVWASKILQKERDRRQETRIKSVIPGVECMEDLVRTAAKQRIPIVLIGGRSGLALNSLECLQKKHLKLTGWAMDGPEIQVTSNKLQVTSENSENYFRDLANKITTSGVRMVFVGLGAPKQEYFIEALSRQLSIHKYPLSIILMSVGGSFDEISGRIPKPPGWVSRTGLKWLWRLIVEPWRIRRQLALLTFVWLVLRERYQLK